MPITKTKLWDEYVEINKDDYSKCCVDVAREAMVLLDKLDLKEPVDANKIICDADDKLDAGITGFMAGAIAQIIFECHSRGEDFKKSWNIGVGGPQYGDAQGVLNPAVLSIKER